jgi:predicted HTH transcriptional regulator
MAISPSQIDLWRQVPTEHQNLEFKEAKAHFSLEKLNAYCVAIANEGGGHLILGIADDPPRPVVGSRAFPDVVATADDLFRALGFRVDVDEVVHPDGRVVVFQIPPRPRGTAYHLEGKYLMRSGETLAPMSEDRLRAIFVEGHPSWLEEPSLKGLEAQAVVDLLDTQGFFELLKRPYPGSREAVVDHLVTERLVDFAIDGYAIRRLGGLLLAKKLEDFPDLARKAARVIVYFGSSKLEPRLDHTFSRGYAVGFKAMVDFVMAQLPQSEVIENALRRQVKLLPDDAIRELIANALIHQDFLIGGMWPVIEIFSNRVEISNPGEPVVQVERFIDGYQSRNERLANLMRRMSLCEERSSGVDRIISAAEAYQLPAPDFRKVHRRTLAVLYPPRPFDEMTRADRIRACYQHCALKYVLAERMTNQSLRERFGIGASKLASMSVIIGATIDVGLIKLDERAGESRRYARYLPFWA